MKLFRFTLFIAVYGQSVTDTTKMEVVSFEKSETQDIVSQDITSATARLDLRGYKERAGVTDDRLIHVNVQELELKRL